jgi:hypothetical protein
VKMREARRRWVDHQQYTWRLLHDARRLCWAAGIQLGGYTRVIGVVNSVSICKYSSTFLAVIHHLYK